MDTVLICPGERPAVGFLAQSLPLVAVPILGESLVASWVEWLANAGSKEILVLATDRPDSVRMALGDGSRWGVRVQVQAELKELAAEELEVRLLDPAFVTDGSRVRPTVVTLDYLPGVETVPLFRSYRDWFAAVQAWVPQVTKLNRIGLHELRPGVWCGSRVQIAASARLEPPCWLGEQVQIGPDVVIGPNAILERRVVVDRAVEIESSLIGPETFVGALTRVGSSIAWGNTLIDWRSGSCTQVPDPFLLCSLGQRSLPGATRTGGATRRWRARVTRSWNLVTSLFRQ